LLNWRIDRRTQRGVSGFPGEPRVESLELPHLAERAPAQIAVSRVAQLGLSDALDASRGVESRRHLVRQPLMPDEAVLARRSNGLPSLEARPEV
jgi:hypothetical protein